MFVSKPSDNEQLDSLDVLGIEDRGEKDQSMVYAEFRENIKRKENGRYEVAVSWILGVELNNTKEESSRKRLHNVTRKLRQQPQIKDEYEKIVHDQLRDGGVEETEQQSNSEHVYSTCLTVQ